MKPAVFTRRSVVTATYSLGFIGGALHQMDGGDEAADRAALHLRR